MPLRADLKRIQKKSKSKLKPLDPPIDSLETYRKKRAKKNKAAKQARKKNR
jgi:hypothetical protein